MTKPDKIRTKPEIPEMDTSKTIRLNDIGFRLILIPFFGIAIPILTKMVPYGDLGQLELKLSFLYTIGIAWVVWEGNRFLLFTLRNYFDWYEKPMRKIGALLLVVPFYTIPLCVILLVIWYRIFTPSTLDWDKIWLATSIILICVVFIVHVYETVFLVKEAESEKVVNAQLETAKMEAELQALKNQIDPHFIFNSLNTLSHFIEENPEKAKLFNQHLSDVYRYILNVRTQNLVTLDQENGFILDYFALLKLRFESAIALELNYEGYDTSEMLIVPISIQMLIENAVKHNNFSDSNPLKIFIDVEDGFIKVANNYHPKVIRDSSKLGLVNLNDRSKMLLQREIKQEINNGEFRVWVPFKMI